LRSGGRNVGYNVAHLQLSAATKTTFGMHKGGLCIPNFLRPYLAV
jgi:hypothetical protein